MYPFQINPDDITLEILDLNRKLAGGLSTLSELKEITVGTSEKEVVYEEDKMILYHFKPRTQKQNPIPVLIVYALVNRPYMADLQDGRSMIQGLLDVGLDVYLIDWGYPDAAERFLTLDDYINRYINNCVDTICKLHGIGRVNLLGICQGGTFSLCYTALNQHKIQNLITTVTPVDFHTKEDLLSNLVRNIDIDSVVDSMGNIPGEVLNWIFLSLKPYRLTGQKYLDFIDILDDREKTENFMKMEKWIFDSPDQAGEAYRQFIKQFYQQNRLIKGTVKIGTQTVNLKNIISPVLNIYAVADHLVPPDSSRALGKHLGTDDYTELEFPGGHIGIYVSSKSQKMIPPAVGKWLDKRKRRTVS